MNPLPSSDRLDRRAALKWMLAGTATLMVLDRDSLAQSASAPGGRGYGTDPDLIKEYKPGDYWPLTLNDHQRRTAAVLCALIIPADDRSPSAADLKVHDFIDEWISAPYAGHDKDRARILDGLAWLDAEAGRRFGKKFIEANAGQQTAICDDLCREVPARAELKEPSLFFKRFRDLTAGGFYTTPEGMKDIQYVGNVPLLTFDGPPPEVLKQLGLA